MRILSWNVNGLNSHKIDMHDTARYIELFDIALLTETRCASSDLFPTFQQISLPISLPISFFRTWEGRPWC